MVGWRECLVGEVFGKVVMARVLLGPAINEEKGQQATKRKTGWWVEEEKRGKVLVQTLGSDTM